MITHRIPFTKAQALGNDFVIVEEGVCALDQLSNLAKLLADRRQGVGCDQAVFYKIATPDVIPAQAGIQEKNRSVDTLDLDSRFRGNDKEGENDNKDRNDKEEDASHFSLRFFNTDGSESEACGNGTRAFALFASTLLNTPNVTLQTKASTFYCTIHDSESTNAQVSVTLSNGTFIPINTILQDDLSFFFEDRLKHAVAIDVGNPHLVLFLEDYTYEDVTDIGEQLTHHPFFKRGVNVSFVKMPPTASGTVVNFPGVEKDPRDKPEDDNERTISTLSLSVYERGVGPTPACGTGAYATYLAARTFLPLTPRFTILQQGGPLIFEEIDTMYKVTGDASLVFEGVFYL